MDLNHLEKTSDAVVRRLPGYYRHLTELETTGVTRISSQALGKRMGLTASQIRQDINCFGGFGQQGYGYNVPRLKKRIGEIMGLDHEHKMAIVGVGNIGRAIALYPGFRQEGFKIVVLFDTHPDPEEEKMLGLPILPVEKLATYLATYPVEIVVIATPARHAQAVADTVAAAGIPAIWNFAPVDLKVPETVEISNVHLSDSLMALSFRMHEREVLKDGELNWIRED